MSTTNKLQPSQYVYYPNYDGGGIILALGFPCQAGTAYRIQSSLTPWDPSSWIDYETFTVGVKPVIHPVYISLSDGIAYQLVQ